MLPGGLLPQQRLFSKKDGAAAVIPEKQNPQKAL